ncbi:MAG: AbrB/MazE/SpoVT family DNA-binding domain-containing protein [Actinomycetota bacterium]|jgi:AbrB family looped-hinge helix DNA binding protein|nr:AbrB/MazE/SpoVT family DNA-binding domain-containing protein [Actinomycetota bacterium]
MPQVTLSSKYQIVVPKEIRKQLHLKGGQKMHVLAKEGVITLIPDRRLEEFRGYLKGMDTSGIREEKDRL